jgi:F-type H+-transporting ATPase subunit delta
MAEAKTVARPYAEAAFALAQKRSQAEAWSGMLALGTIVASDARIGRLDGDPSFDRARLADVVVGICGEGQSPEAQNFLRVLVDNRRLTLLPEIAQLFEQMRCESEARVEATVISAFALDPAQVKSIAAGLKRRFGRDVNITTQVDSALIGGVLIQAADLVIDASVRGRLNKLAASLNL